MANIPLGSGAPKALIGQFRHEMHLLEDQLKRFESSGADLSESTRKQMKLLRDRIKRLESEASKLPEVAQALGLEKKSSIAPVDIKPIVPESQFETFEVHVEETSRIVNAPLRSEWPRTAKAIVGENRLADLETFGKVRLHMNTDDGEPVSGAEFHVVALKPESDEEIVLRNGYTDAHGYASVNLNNVLIKDIKNLSIVVGAIEEKSSDEEPEFRRFDIHEAHIATHRDLGIPHRLKIPDTTIENIQKKSVVTSEDGTVENPDASDVRNSPDSFGLNVEGKDGNCCLRPQKEFPSRQYFFRQIVRINPPMLVSSHTPPGGEVVNTVNRPVPSGTTDDTVNTMLKDRAKIQAPIPYGKETQSDYVIRGGSPLLGFVNLYSQSWYPVGRGLGEVLYSLALAPCEQVNLAFIDWTRNEVDTRSEFTKGSERFEHELNHDRTISEVVESVLDESQSGSSASGGGAASIDLGFFSAGGGGGYTTSSASGRREIQASTVQEVSDQVVQQGSSMRSLRSTVVTTSVQQESERIKTRTVHNHNRNHAMTVQYFQVLSHHTVKTELVEEKPVLLIPYEIDDDIFDEILSFQKFVLTPSRPITQFLDRHRALLMRLVPFRFRPAFDSLSRLLHCGDVYGIEEPFATVSRWRISLDQAWREGLNFSIETNGDQSYPLRRLGRTNERSTVEFTSDPVNISTVVALRVSFDPVRAAESTAGSGIFGDLIEEMLKKAAEHLVTRCEIHYRTDRSRFVPEPQSFRMVVDLEVGVTLSASIAVVGLPGTPKSVDFKGYRGREHKDYCLVKELIAHIQANPMRFLLAIWLRENPDRRAIRFDRFNFQGKPLLDQIINRPVGVLGNYVAFPLLEGHRLVPSTQPNHIVDERLLSLPTRGVFAEVFLSCCNATEKRDVERVIDPENTCQAQAPDITGVQPGSRRERRDLQPTPFPSPIVSPQNAPGVPDPTGLASALSVLQTPNIFRDLTRGAELLQFIDNATKEAFTSTRQHRAAMDAVAGDVVRGLVSSYTGADIPNSSSSGAASSGTTGITPSQGDETSGSGAPGIPRSASSSGHALQQTAASELLRRTSPQRVSDHLQTVQRAVNSGLITAEQGNQSASGLLAGGFGDEASIIPAAFIPTPAGGTMGEPEPRPCCIFQPDPGLGISNIVELADLTTHFYGDRLAYQSGREKSGLIYTCKGGFIDLGHARDWADWTGFLAAKAKSLLSAGGTVSLRHDGDSRTVSFISQGAVPGDELCILLAQRIAYEMAIWHEIITWFPGVAQRYSSFSPEDNYSNLIGTYMGADALRSPKSFEAAVVDAIQDRLTKLKPLPKTETLNAFNAVKLRWWKEWKLTISSPLPPADAVLRRHFDALGTVTPWLVSGLALCAGDAAIPLNVPTTGLGGKALSLLYKLELGVPSFFPTSAKAVTAGGGTSPITPADYPALIAHIKTDAKASFGPDADKP